jgi:hypothetical protein
VSADPEEAVPIAGPASPARILTYHQRKDAGSCLCGWSELGASHAQHQVDMLTAHVEPLGTVLTLHALYQAMYRVHGKEQTDWLTSAPAPVLKAYSAVQQHIRRLSQ